MQLGLDFEVSFALLQKLRKEGDAVRSGLLECVLCGGLWTPAGVADAFEGLGLCPLCGAPDADESHLFLDLSSSSFAVSWCCCIHSVPCA